MLNSLAVARVARVLEQELLPARQVDAQATEEAQAVGRYRPHDLVQRDVLVLAGARLEHELIARVLVVQRVDLFTRQEHDNFELVAAASGLDQTRHRLPGATPRERKKARGTDVQWSGIDLDWTVKVLDATCASHGHATPGS